MTIIPFTHDYINDLICTDIGYGYGNEFTLWVYATSDDSFLIRMCYADATSVSFWWGLIISSAIQCSYQGRDIIAFGGLNQFLIVSDITPPQLQTVIRKIVKASWWHDEHNSI